MFYPKTYLRSDKSIITCLDHNLTAFFNTTKMSYEKKKTIKIFVSTQCLVLLTNVGRKILLLFAQCFVKTILSNSRKVEFAKTYAYSITIST